MSTKRTVLITGCSDGSLGSHLALQFHAPGWRVFASARNMAKLKLAKEVGIETIQLDTLSSESVAACVSQIKALTGGTLDGLIDNTAKCLIAHRRDPSLPPLLLASEHKDGALLINHGSLSGVIAASGPFAGAYNASKSAVASFTETMRLELAPFNLKVLNLVTGAVRSTSHVNARRPQLPPHSLYAVARETVERAIDTEDDEGDTDPSQWARCMVAQVSWRSPPRMVGLDVVERNVKAQVQRQRQGGRYSAGGRSDDGKI
ncbi:hypothetical protein BJX68DRAFT_257435 [Aspergillus pseudodeflectus]|uniref:NAD(P)-binding protein n=1 Tax=Aspergillus pseudodeflectus TaxID=176178 RepID=A0ABR4JUC8_9EURO